MKTVYASALLIVAFSSTAQAQLSTAFTYQGRLVNGGSPASGSYDLRVTLFRELSGGLPYGAGAVCVDNLAVSQGLFTVPLDFGAIFGGSDLFMEMEVRADTGLGCADLTGFALLTPRQRISAAPNALFSVTAENAFNASYLNGAAASFYQNAANLNTGLLSDDRLTSNVCLNDREQSFTDEKHFAARPTFDNATIPFTVESNARIQNLNADLLDGHDSSAFMSWSPMGPHIYNTNAGNVGIGTTTPQAKLHVAGVPDNDGIMFPDGSLQVSASPWRVRPEKTFYLDGNVGIGTQDPTTLLHLKPTLDQTCIRIEADRYETAPDADSDSSGSATQVTGSDANWANPAFASSLNGASATATITTPTGDNQTDELDIRNFGFNVPSNATIAGVRVELTGGQSGNCSNCAAPYGRIEYIDTARLVNGSSMSNTKTDRSTTVSASMGGSSDLWGMALTPAIVNSANFGVRFRVRMIPVSTYVDITHPNGAPVDCPGCTASSSVSVDGVEVTIYYGSPTLAHAEYTVGIGPSGTDFRISPSPDFTADGLTVNQDGEVDIAFGTGGVRLFVHGGAAKNGGGSWTSISDARLKQNILPLEGTLDRLLYLRGYSFEYTDDALARKLGLPGRQMGLIAQEVERVFPDWIDYTDGGYRMVTERATTALMVEALRDLRAEKDRQIAELVAENSKLCDRLNALESAVQKLTDENNSTEALR